MFICQILNIKYYVCAPNICRRELKTYFHISIPTHTHIHTPNTCSDSCLISSSQFRRVARDFSHRRLLLIHNYSYIFVSVCLRLSLFIHRLEYWSSVLQPPPPLSNTASWSNTNTCGNTAIVINSIQATYNKKKN